MNVLDLFSGIGGFSLGLERAGFKTVAFCEIDPFCQSIIKKHWPRVPCYDDVATLTAARLDKRIDLICGGFPCQDISLAGKGAGIEGERSGLWSEYARIIGEVRPRYVIVENVAALLGRGLGVVLGDLAALGFDAEWNCIPASAVGAPHRRDRIWIVAHRQREGLEGHAGDGAGRAGRQEQNGPIGACGVCADVANADDGRQQGERFSQYEKQQGAFWREPDGRGARRSGPRAEVSHSAIDAAWPRLFTERPADDGWRDRLGDPDWWLVEPDVGRVAHGVPARVDRLRALGNAIVPQIAEIIGRAIIEGEANAKV